MWPGDFAVLPYLPFMLPDSALTDVRPAAAKTVSVNKQLLR